MELRFDVQRLGGLVLQMQNENAQSRHSWLLIWLVGCNGCVDIAPVALEQARCCCHMPGGAWYLLHGKRYTLGVQCGRLGLGSGRDCCSQRQYCLNVCVDVDFCCIVHLHRSLGFSMEMVIISCLPDAPSGKQNFCEEIFRSRISDKTLENELDSILFIREVTGYDRWGERKPYRPGKVAAENFQIIPKEKG